MIIYLCSSNMKYLPCAQIGTSQKMKHKIGDNDGRARAALSSHAINTRWLCTVFQLFICSKYIKNIDLYFTEHPSSTVVFFSSWFFYTCVLIYVFVFIFLGALIFFDFPSMSLEVLLGRGGFMLYCYTAALPIFLKSLLINLYVQCNTC